MSIVQRACDKALRHGAEDPLPFGPVRTRQDWADSWQHGEKVAVQSPLAGLGALPYHW